MLAAPPALARRRRGGAGATALAAAALSGEVCSRYAARSCEGFMFKLGRAELLPDAGVPTAMLGTPRALALPRVV